MNFLDRSSQRSQDLYTSSFSCISFKVFNWFMIFLQELCIKCSQYCHSQIYHLTIFPLFLFNLFHYFNPCSARIEYGFEQV